jgi:hypothetical protein
MFFKHHVILFVLLLAACKGLKSSEESIPKLAAGSTVAPGYRCQTMDEEIVRLNPHLGQEDDFVWVLGVGVGDNVVEMNLFTDLYVINSPQTWNADRNQVRLEIQNNIESEYSKNPDKLVLTNGWTDGTYRKVYMKTSIDIKSGVGQLTYLDGCIKRRPVPLKCQAIQFAAEPPKIGEKLYAFTQRGLKEIPAIDFRYRETQAAASGRYARNPLAFYSFVNPYDQRVSSLRNYLRRDSPIINDSFEIIGYTRRDWSLADRTLPKEIENYFRRYEHTAKTLVEPLKQEATPPAPQLSPLMKGFSEFMCHFFGQPSGNAPSPITMQPPVTPRYEPIVLTYLGDSAYTTYVSNVSRVNQRGFVVSIPEKWKNPQFIEDQFHPNFENDINDYVVKKCNIWVK